MRTIDNDGVGIGNINAVLDNSRREQHVIVIFGEAQHRLFHFLGLHLSVPDGDTAVGDIFLNHLSEMRQVADTVVDEVNLPIARHLEIDGFDDDLWREGVNLRLDRIAIGRRCLDDAEITGSEERELECSWDGSGRHGQCVDIGLQLAQLLLSGHAKLLLFIDNQKP